MLLGPLAFHGHVVHADALNKTGEVISPASPATSAADATPDADVTPQSVPTATGTAEDPDTLVAPNKLSAKAALAMLHSVKDPYWVNALNAEEDPATVSDFFFQHQDENVRGIRRRTLLEGDTAEKDIALTFDDGPHPDFTPRLLAILKQYNVKATFFVVGEMAERAPELVQDEINDGNSVGNHTYNHVSLVKIPQEYIGAEIKACGEVLHGITDQTPHLFRPPGGRYDPVVAETSETLGYTTILWTDDPGDYASPGVDTIVSRTVDKATPGGIILLHDGPEQTLEALPQIITILRARGYHFITIDQMLREKDLHHPLTAPALLTAKYP